jgi:hypothetical protein
MFGIDIPAWALGVGFIILAASIGGAVKRLLGGDRGGDDVRRRLRGRLSKRMLGEVVDDLQGKLGDADELRGRLDELEDVQRRLTELEERVDFAERLLGKQREAERVAPPKP